MSDRPLPSGHSLIPPVISLHRLGLLPRVLLLAAALSGTACATVERHHAFEPSRVLEARRVLAADGHAELPDEDGKPRRLSLTEPITPRDLHGEPVAEPQPLSRWLERCAVPAPPDATSPPRAAGPPECLSSGGTLDTTSEERGPPAASDVEVGALVGGVGAGLAGFVACQAACSPENRTRADVAGGIALAALLFAFLFALHTAFRTGD